MSHHYGSLRGKRLFPLCLSLIIFLPPSLGAQAPDPNTLLAEADRLAWVKNWTRAEPLFAQAERLFAEQGDRRNQLYAHISKVRGHLPRLSLSQVSSQLDTLLDDPLLQQDLRLKLRCLTVKGDVDMDLDSDLAERDWSEALATAKTLGDKAWEARANGELGIIAFLQGDSATASIKVGGAIQSAFLSGDLGAQIRYLTLLGSGYVEFGRPEKALDILERALALVAQSKDLSSPMLTWHAKVNALVALKRTPEATALLEQALLVARQEQSPGYEATLLIQLGLLAAQSRHRTIAIQHLEQALVLARRAESKRLEAQVNLELAKLRLAAKDWLPAERATLAGLQVSRAISDRYYLPRHLSNYASLKIARRQYRAADALYEESTDIVNGMLLNVSSPSAKSSLVAAMDEIFIGHFRLHATYLRNPVRAFAILEQARGRAVADLLRSRPANPGTLSARLTVAERELFHLQTQLETTRSRTQRKRLLEGILLAEQAMSRVETADNRAWMRVQTQPVAVKSLQKALQPSELLLEFVIVEPASYCLALSREGLRIYTLPGKAKINQQVQALLAAVRDAQDTQPAAQALYASLLQPITDLPQKQRLLIVPDGSLHNMPFELLTNSSNISLLASHVVSYTPSGTAFALLHSAPSLAKQVAPLLAVAGVGLQAGKPNGEAGVPIQRGIYDLESTAVPPLAAATDEAKAVANIAGTTHSVLLTGLAATESAFKAQPLQLYSILHFAVHGLVSTKFPERSALVFQPDPARSEDGLLQAREISNLRLQAELVTLSACRTGSGRVNGQEGVANLVRPFLLAGARTVVANLWEADDEFSRGLMQEFYQRLARGEDKAQALQRAKLTLMRKYGSQAPARLWAGFVMVGDGTGYLAPRRSGTSD